MQSKFSNGKIFSLITAFVFLLSLLPPIPIQAESDAPNLEEYVLKNSWGGESNVFNEPTDVAIGPDGRIYVVNRGLNRITIITPGSAVFKNFGNFGYAEGQLVTPEAIAIDNNGYIYVAGNSFVSKFTANGEFIKRWGYFSEASGIAVDNNGYVYVVDSGNHRVRKFTSEGVSVKSWGSEGSGAGKFNFPQGIAIDSFNKVYVADSQNHRIQIFDSNGAYLNQWGGWGTANGQFIWPFNVEIGSRGKIFVSDWGNYRVQVFDADLEYLTKWGIYGTEEVHFRSPRGMAVDSKGNIIVAVAGINLIHKYSPTFEFITQWGVKPTTPGQFHWPNDIAVDNNGNIFVADTNNRRVQKFNPYGVFLTQWEINYDGPNLTWPIKIALDSTGNVYVLDLIHSQVQKFDSNGNKITNWKIQEGIIAVNQDYPTGIAIFEDQYIYISGGHNNLLHKFNLSDGSHVKNWGGLGSSTGKFNYPVDVAVDSDGCVYVADANNYRIQKFDENGNYLTDWGVPGEMEGQFNDVTSIITDANGFVYVLDSVNRNIQAFTKGGYYVSRWNTLSLKSEEQLASPRGFALDNDGNIYISDTYNHRIQVLAPGLPELDPETGLILNGSFEPVEADSGSAMIMSEASLDLVTTQNSDRGAVVGLDHWTYGGDLPVNRTTNTYEGNYSVQLGLPEEANEQGISSAWITQVFYVPYDGIPVLTFNYNVFTKDSIDQSDFIVEIQDGVGLSNKAVVVRDGFRPSAPGETPEGTVELGWKSVVFSLGRYRGRFIRLAISNRIMSPNSQGIWSYVENISVSTDGTSFSLPLKSFLPLLIR